MMREKKLGESGLRALAIGVALCGVSCGASTSDTAAQGAMVEDESTDSAPSVEDTSSGGSAAANPAVHPSLSGNPAETSGANELPPMPVAECDGSRLEQGISDISGIPAYDGYFSAIIAIEAESERVEAEVAAGFAELQQLMGATSTGSADLAAAYFALTAQFAMSNVETQAWPARCFVIVDTVRAALAVCEDEVAADTTLECAGACVPKEPMPVTCPQESLAACRAQVTGEACVGRCLGECTVDAASCVGSCPGNCSGTCTVAMDGTAACDGACIGPTDDRGRCDGGCEIFLESGTCEGLCQGECSEPCSAEISSAGMCLGLCSGSCEFVAANAACLDDATLLCIAEAGAEIPCSGRCDGSLGVPGGGFCAVAAIVRGQIAPECDPVDIHYSYDPWPELSAQEIAQFDTVLGQIMTEVETLYELAERLSLLERASTEIIDSMSVLLSSAEAQQQTSADNAEIAALQCVVETAVRIPGVISDSAARRAATASDLVQFVAGISD